ncbi:MAG TPA: hypothetical protein VHX86_15470 [Tepidisphaeraceae bacterium]|nr:hypothetical protein [Tepidisphaeraceae bacterium]
MTYLVDANVLLETALRRQQWESAQKFLAAAAARDLAISTFTLHSLGFFLIRRTDAFVYAIAEMYDLRIVSFDSDFDRAPRGRLTPAQALDQMAHGESSV